MAPSSTVTARRRKSASRLSDIKAASYARPIRARYDAASTTDENRNHWKNADALAAMAALSPFVRATLRNRARYEVANNSYASGIVRTLANDTIGTGPTVRFLTGVRAADQGLERLYRQWSNEISFAPKLRTMRKSKATDGEAFGVFKNNYRLRSPIKLDLQVYESDQFEAKPGAAELVTQSGGIVLDDFGNPATYTLLKHHPGSTLGGSLEAEMIRASNVVHWFDAERPGQYRGVSELTPAIPLFAQLRRYTLAVIAAAETVADIAAFMKSVGPTVDPEEIEPLDTIDIEKRMLMTLPQGWDIAQIKSEQPATTYEMFVRAILREIARCLSMPYNIAAGDSSNFNYASGRLDHQTYFKARRVDRSTCRSAVIEPTIRAFWLEARRIVEGIPREIADNPEPPEHAIGWPGDQHVDPLKEANAATKLIEANLLTEAEHAIERGVDWEEIEAQRAKELGVSVEELRRLKREKLFGGIKPQASKNEPDDEDED